MPIPEGFDGTPGPTDKPNRSDPARLRAVAFANSYRGLQPWLDSTGLCNHELHSRALGQSARARPAEDFLLASRIRREDARVPMSTRPYFTDSGLTAVSLIDADTVAPSKHGAVRLPASSWLPGSFGDVLTDRRSGRRFSGHEMSLADLAALIRSAAGRTGAGRVRLSDGDDVTMAYHAAPSGGGLRPVSMHVAAMSVQGLPDSIVRYDARHDTLAEPTHKVSARDVLGTCLSPPDLEYLPDAAAIFLFVGRPWRTMRKYGDRGVRFLLLEAGAMAQNIHLAAGALGLPNVACGAFCDDEVHNLLGIDGVHDVLVHAVAVGCAPEADDSDCLPAASGEGT